MLTWLTDPRKYKKLKLVVFLLLGLWIYNILGGVRGFIQIALMMTMMIMQFIFLFYMLSRVGTYDRLEPDEIGVTWADVYGQDKVVERVKEVQYFLEHPEEIEQAGGKVPKGILLYGPPGTGKTLIAKALAASIDAPFFLAGPGSFTNMFMGVGILKVKRLFRDMRKACLKSGRAVVFMDEMDSLGNRGSSEEKAEGLFPKISRIVMGGMGGGGMGTLETFLSEIDGLQKARGLGAKLAKKLGAKLPPVPPYRILIIGATNMPERLDAALTRPGRLDRKLRVGFPNLEGRVETFRGYLGRVQHNITEEQILLLAKKNPRGSGAVINDAVNEALIKTLRAGRQVIEWKDLRDAIIWKEMGEDEGRQPYEEDQRRVAIHEAAHAVVAHHFRKSDKIDFASVVMRGRTLGVVSSVPMEERHTQTKSEIEGDIKVFLASHWAESEWYNGDVSSGPQSDLNTANRLADLYLHSWAMGPTLNVVLENETEVLSEWLYDSREEFLVEQYNELSEFLSERKDQIEAIAALLDKYDTVDGEEIHRILNTMELEKR